MATQKPISTISYNTENFLREKLDSLVENHILQAYQYIHHKGEDGDKDHFHLRVEPNKRIDPMDLSEVLKEHVCGESKPRCVRTWRPSKEEDWFLYAVHDETYLKIKYGGGDKGEKLQYSWSDIVASENYDVETAFIRAKSHLEHTAPNVLSRLQSGSTTASKLISEGVNPFIVNAVTRTLAGSEYESLVTAYNELNETHSKLLEAIEKFGLTVEVDDDGSFILTDDFPV